MSALEIALIILGIVSIVAAFDKARFLLKARALASAARDLKADILAAQSPGSELGSALSDAEKTLIVNRAIEVVTNAGDIYQMVMDLITGIRKVVRK